MSKVLHAQTDFTSYVQYTFPGTHTEVYAQWYQSISASANAGTFEGFLFLINGSGVVDNIRIVGHQLKTKWAVGPFGPDLVPYVFYKFGLHSKLTAGTLATHVTVNGVDVGTITNVGATGLAAMTGFKIGGIATGTFPDEVWLDNLTVGTTSFGSSDLFSGTFETGGFSSFTSDHSTDSGLFEIVTEPDVRVGVNPAGGGIFDTGTNSTRLDALQGLSVQRISVHRGRPGEREKTGVGTATISGVDTSGAIDPTGPGVLTIDPTAQTQIALRHPITGSSRNIFVGFTADLDYTMYTTQRHADFELACVDALDILADAEVIPDVAGNTVPTESTGDVYYDPQNVDDRIRAALADAALSAGVTEWPAALTDIFSGNVAVQGTVYSPRTSILQVIQDAADAEFPGVANFFASKDGIVTFHGRHARFNPSDVSYGITTWHVGDEFFFSFDDTLAVLSQITLTRGKENLINAALATPTGIADADIAGQFVSDSGSITSYGARSISFENLITESGLEVGTPTALVETKKYASYYVDNFAAPANRVKQIVFRPPAGAAWAEKTWDLIIGVEISDIVHLQVNFLGGSLDTDYFVEGITYDIDYLGGANFPNVTLTLDVSPRVYYTTDSLGGS